MAGNVSEESSVGRSMEGKRCQSSDALVDWRSSEQVENGTPSTSPPYWDTDDSDDDGGFSTHVDEISLPYKPDFKVMPEGWDGTTRDPDEGHFEISKKEDDMLYEEFLQRFNFNKMKFKGEVKVHKYSRRRCSDGWDFTVEKLGPRGKRGNGGGWKFVSHPDGSTRPLNEVEKMYVKRETPRRRRRILP